MNVGSKHAGKFVRRGPQRIIVGAMPPSPGELRAGLCNCAEGKGVDETGYHQVHRIRSYCVQYTVFRYSVLTSTFGFPGLRGSDTEVVTNWGTLLLARLPPPVLSAAHANDATSLRKTNYCRPPNWSQVRPRSKLSAGKIGF